MPRKPTPTVAELIRDERYLELENFSQNVGSIHKWVHTVSSLHTGRPVPVLSGLGARAVSLDTQLLSPRPRNLDGFGIAIPKSAKSLQDVHRAMYDAKVVIRPEGATNKIGSTADYISTYKGYTGVMTLEYNMAEPFVIHDTEAFVRQATKRKLSLMFRNGFEVIGENQRNVNYINRCLNSMEYVLTNGGTLTTIKGFFTSILFSLLLCSNCFLLKIRDLNASPGVRHKRNQKKDPVAAYVFIPAHTIMPVLEKGVIKKWRRFFDTGQPFEDFDVDDIVHFKWDCKAGHIAGTPRLVAVREDIYALRRLEENIELLFINHLFPLFHVKVGTEEEPAAFKDGVSEVDIVKYQIETMPKEGIFVTDNRVTVEAVGAEGESLDPKDILTHYKNRVFCGLGVSPLDMGEADTANRSTADNVSQVLKDTIKHDWEIFSGLVRMGMFREWFLAAPHSLSVLNATATTHLQAHEIDLDNKLKEENGIIQLYLNNLIDLDETRKRLKMQGTPDEKKTHYWMHIRDLAVIQAKLKAAATAAKASPGAKTSATRARPTNQHKTNPGPTKAKSAMLPELRKALLDELEMLQSTGDCTPAVWREHSAKICDQFGTMPEKGTVQFSAEPYTSQVRTGMDRLALEVLKDQVALTQDPELLALLLESELDPNEDPASEDDDEQPSNLAVEPDPPDFELGEYAGINSSGTGDPEPGDVAAP